jgi:ADP-ribose pyrophosphatase YjhB (NUDIX family)
MIGRHLFAFSRNSRCARSFSVVLPHNKAPFDSIKVHSSDVSSMDEATFESGLNATIESSIASKTQAIYFHVNIPDARLIPVARRHGFELHNADGEVITMLKWLASGECKVPPFGTHLVGVGGLVLHESNVLVVKENQYSSRWKLPGGYVKLDEDLSTAAEREVWEETGVRSKFQSIINFRNQHQSQFGRGDIYAICLLQALTTDVVVDEEVEDARWMDLGEFKAYNRIPMLTIALDLLDRRDQAQTTPSHYHYHGLEETTLDSVVPGRRPYKFYSPANPA